MTEQKNKTTDQFRDVMIKIRKSTGENEYLTHEIVRGLISACRSKTDMMELKVFLLSQPERSFFCITGDFLETLNNFYALVEEQLEEIKIIGKPNHNFEAVNIGDSLQCVSVSKKNKLFNDKLEYQVVSKTDKTLTMEVKLHANHIADFCEMLQEQEQNWISIYSENRTIEFQGIFDSDDVSINFDEDYYYYFKIQITMLIK